MSHSPSPLQIATKIHFYLMRELGRGIDVEQMLQHPRYARDVLLVCDACAGTELADLASQYRRVRALYDSLEASRPSAAPGRAAQPTEWAKDTTGFGLSRPLEDDADPRPHGPASAGVRQWLTRWRQR
ncbi:hypothetical protein HLB44_03325 [Aquincola sp. S2]|uniref:Uncharacterized protein n=1 Tax=Pseudaquabacterium terrae TaxID=2732868 RepID=A0ABX2EC69_9BURK|nr:hypothetical protein [Aquabacterium terrae]NRF66014.1 hypothetical protein [Aquabacterium terrae]